MEETCGSDVKTDEIPVDEDVNCWRESDPSDSRSPDSTRRSLSSVKPEGPTSTLVVGGRATQSDDRFVPTTPTDGA